MRLSSASCTPADRAAFEAWRREQPSHAQAYSSVERMLAEVDSHIGIAEFSELGEQVLAATQLPPQRRSYAAVTSAAAVLILVLGVVIYQNQVADPSASLRMAAPVVYETAIGERSTAILPDGSSVVLNTSSRVEVDYSDDSRKLTLVRGQAHFEVRKERRLFEVIAADRRIVALGTAFDVRLKEDSEVLVTLLEGRISVDEIVTGVVGEVRGNSVAQLEHNELAAGEQLIAYAGDPTTVGNADIERVTSWRQGRLVFRNDALSEAVQEINRYSTRQLLLGADARLEEIRISGVFNAGSITTFVLALESVHPIAAQQINQDQTVLLWQE